MNIIIYDNETKSFALGNIKPKLTGDLGEDANRIDHAALIIMEQYQKSHPESINMSPNEISIKSGAHELTKKWCEESSSKHVNNWTKSSTGMTLDELQSHIAEEEKRIKKDKLKTSRKSTKVRKVTRKSYGVKNPTSSSSNRTQYPKVNVPGSRSENSEPIKVISTKTPSINSKPNDYTRLEGNVSKVNPSKRSNLTGMGLGTVIGAGVGAASTIGLKKRLLKKGYTEKEADRKVKKAMALRSGIGALGGAALGAGARSLHKRDMK